MKHAALLLALLLSWHWTRGSGAPAVGFGIERAYSANGPWFTIYTIYDGTARKYRDPIGKAGDCYRVLAFNQTSGSTIVQSFSPPSGVACAGAKSAIVYLEK